MKNVGFQLKRWLIISPFTLVFISLPSTGLAIDVKNVPKLSSASQEFTQETHLPWVPLAGGGALVLAIAATTYLRHCRHRKLVKPSPSRYTSQVSSSQGSSQRYNYVHSGSRDVEIDVDVDIDIIDSCDGNNSDRIDWSNQLDSCESSSYDSTSSSFGDDSSGAGDSYFSPESSDSSSSWSNDESDRDYNYKPSNCSSYENDSSWNSDTSNCSNYDSDSSWNSNSSDSSWSSDSSSSWSSDSDSSYDSSSSSDYGGGSSDGGGADSSW